MTSPHRKSLAASLGALALAACATITTGEAPQPEYARDAEGNLERGNQALKNKNYLEARLYFDFVRTRYPYKEVATQAELRLADTLFAQEQYIEARDAYQAFAKLHPTWPAVDYAAYRAALTHYKEIPADFFLVPPSTEKDQTALRHAVRAMQEFVRQYPKSEYVPEAQKIVDEGRRRMARHELYVASFYKRRERWPAVANRLETVARDYQGLGFDEEALFGLHDAYSRVGDKEKAKKALEEVVARLPGTPAAEKARALLASGS